MKLAMYTLALACLVAYAASAPTPEEATQVVPDAALELVQESSSDDSVSPEMFMDESFLQSSAAKSKKTGQAKAKSKITSNAHVSILMGKKTRHPAFYTSVMKRLALQALHNPKNLALVKKHQRSAKQGIHLIGAKATQWITKGGPLYMVDQFKKAKSLKGPAFNKYVQTWMTELAPQMSTEYLVQTGVLTEADAKEGLIGFAFFFVARIAISAGVRYAARRGLLKLGQYVLRRGAGRFLRKKTAANAFQFVKKFAKYAGKKLGKHAKCQFDKCIKRDCGTSEFDIFDVPTTANIEEMQHKKTQPNTDELVQAQTSSTGRVLLGGRKRSSSRRRSSYSCGSEELVAYQKKVKEATKPNAKLIQADAVVQMGWGSRRRRRRTMRRRRTTVVSEVTQQCWAQCYEHCSSNKLECTTGLKIPRL